MIWSIIEFLLEFADSYYIILIFTINLIFQFLLLHLLSPSIKLSINSGMLGECFLGPIWHRIQLIIAILCAGHYSHFHLHQTTTSSGMLDPIKQRVQSPNRRLFISWPLFSFSNFPLFNFSTHFHLLSNYQPVAACQVRSGNGYNHLIDVFLSVGHDSHFPISHYSTSLPTFSLHQTFSPTFSLHQTTNQQRHTRGMHFRSQQTIDS